MKNINIFLENKFLVKKNITKDIKEPEDKYFILNPYKEDYDKCIKDFKSKNLTGQSGEI